MTNEAKRNLAVRRSVNRVNSNFCQLVGEYTGVLKLAIAHPDTHPFDRDDYKRDLASLEAAFDLFLSRYKK